MNYLLMSDATLIVYTILVVLALLGLILLLVWAINKNYIKDKETQQALIAGTLTWPELVTVIQRYTASNENAKYSLLYVDIDRFTQFTTVFGKKEGMELINLVAKRILSILPKKSLVAKYTGDRFIIFFPDNFKREDVYEYGKDILNEFRKVDNSFNNVEVDLTASICLAFYPSHGKTLDLMVDSLKLGIVKIKRNGGDDFFVYSGSFQTNVKDIEYSNELNSAIENKEFRVFYKPVYNLNNDSVPVIETSYRWEHPQLGLIQESKFLNIMEQTGDILWIGQFGIESVVSMYLQIKQVTENVPLLTFKLSPKQLINAKTPNLIGRVLRRFKVSGSNFILEIGEFVLFAKDEKVKKNIQELKKLGFKIGIIGFPTNHKNFPIIESFGVDYIIFDINLFDEAMGYNDDYLKLLIEYMKQHNKEIIFNGIDKQEDLDRLKDKNINLVLGDILHREIPGGEIVEFIKMNQKK